MSKKSTRKIFKIIVPLFVIICLFFVYNRNSEISISFDKDVSNSEEDIFKVIEEKLSKNIIVNLDRIDAKFKIDQNKVIPLKYEYNIYLKDNNDLYINNDLTIDFVNKKIDLIPNDYSMSIKDLCEDNQKIVLNNKLINYHYLNNDFTINFLKYNKSLIIEFLRKNYYSYEFNRECKKECEIDIINMYDISCPDDDCNYSHLIQPNNVWALEYNPDPHIRKALEIDMMKIMELL